MSRSSNSIDKYQNRKVGRRNPGSNPVLHSCVWVYFQWITTSSKTKKKSGYKIIWFEI